MEVIGWIVASVLFIIAFVGLVYPIIPSALFLVGGFLLYGLIDTFDGMTMFVLDYSNIVRRSFIWCRHAFKSCRCEKVRWVESGDVGKHNWSSSRSFRYSCRGYSARAFFRRGHFGTYRFTNQELSKR